MPSERVDLTSGFPAENPEERLKKLFECSNQVVLFQIS